MVRLLVNGTFLHYKFESKNAASETVRQEEMCECQVDRLGREWPAAATHSLTDSGGADVSGGSSIWFVFGGASAVVTLFTSLTTVLILPRADIV